ncbi:hypothetical protein SSX86_025467 [Deinandra increscens subsp. villosa]|uniref:Uncharacterized protein n=1 Tax=Deinandra increscens subsp. villosa TaxID=3103831 RepID=A0AAP0GN90_9ASTR
MGSVIESIHGGGLRNSISVRKGEGVWNNICKLVQDLHSRGIIPVSSFKKDVGLGNETRFRVDNWIGEEPLLTMFPRLYALENNKNCFVCHRMPGGDRMWEWRRPIRSGVEEAQFCKLNALLNSPVRINNSGDSWKWNLDGKSEFEVKAIRKKIEEVDLKGNFPPTRWNKSVPIKINIFV